MSPNPNPSHLGAGGPRTPLAPQSFHPLLTPPETPLRARSDRPPITRLKKQRSRAKILQQFEKKLRASRPPVSYPVAPTLHPPLPPPDPGLPPSLQSPFSDGKVDDVGVEHRLVSPNASGQQTSLIDLTHVAATSSSPSQAPRASQGRRPSSAVRKPPSLRKKITSNGGKYRVAKAAPSISNADEVIEITSDSGPEQPYRAPGEKWYYGSGSKRSRVGTSKDDQPSPPRTRGWRRRAEKPVSSDDEKHNAIHARRPPTFEDYDTKAKRLAKQEEERVFKAWANPAYERLWRKTGPEERRPDYVIPDLSDDDDDPPDALLGLGIRKKDTHPLSSPISHSPPTARGSNSVPLGHDESSSEDLDNRPHKKRHIQTVSFVADEAEQEGGTGSDSQEDDMYTDDYDREDSFIDDDPDNSTSFWDHRPSPSPSAAAPSSSSRASRPSQNALGAASVEDQEVEGDSFMPSDEDTALEVAKVQSFFSDLRPYLSKEEYEDKLKSVTRAFKMAAKSGARRGGSLRNKTVASSRKGKERAIVLSDDGDSPQQSPIEHSFPSSHTSTVGDVTTSTLNALTSPGLANTPAASVVPTPTSSTQGPPSVGAIVGPVPSTLTMSQLLASNPGAAQAADAGMAGAKAFVTVNVPLPATDQTYDQSTQDVFLAKDYTALCPLPKGQLIPWSNARGQGPWSFSLWGKVAPNLNASLALAAIKFQESGNFVNPSRAPPINLQLRDIPAKTPRFHLMRDYKPVICVACGLVLRANLQTAMTHYMKQKQIHILFHGQEWERNVGWTCAVMGEESLLAPVFMDGMQMTTKTDSTRENGSKSKAIGYNPNPAPSPDRDGFALSTDAEVPVYDARNTQAFNFNTDLPHLRDRLPKWSEGELPKGSCVVVGYTMAKYMSNKGQWALGCNIHWVLVLGLPDPAVVHDLCCVPSRNISAGMAAIIARSTTSMGTAFNRTFDGHNRRCQFGGGARKRYFDAAVLRGCLNESGEEIEFNTARYDMIMYVDELRVPDALQKHQGSFACQVPMSVVLEHLTVPELRDLARMHNVATTSHDIRLELLNKLINHDCGEPCDNCYAILKPFEIKNRMQEVTVVDIEDPLFLKTASPLSIDDFDNVLPPNVNKGVNIRFHLTGVFRNPVGDPLPGSFRLEQFNHWNLAKRLTVAGLRSLASAHGLALPSKWLKSQCKEALKNHVCHNCDPLTFEFRPMASQVQNLSSGKKKEEPTPFLWEAYVPLVQEAYPPKPTTMRDVARAMRGYCNDSDPKGLEERGCSVCGQLTKLGELGVVEGIHEHLNVLVEPGVTRVERHSLDTPPTSGDDPVLLPGELRVCSMCSQYLLRGIRPRTAMANHLWLGEVPDELKDLTLAEQTLISRVRHNRCVVRVSSGHAKMIANVIAFEHPSLKIYQKLPVSRTDLEEILAVIYTGISPPTAEDLKRTPVLVRRNRVRRALEWLKMNHENYKDLLIDYETLDTYGLEGVPVEVLHRTTGGEDGNVEPAAMSQFDNEHEQGTESGPCPFTVHGLTTDKFVDMTSSQRKAAALQHMKNGGNFLAVGHASEPQSIYNNPALYPCMFPWLFPYGLGGLGQDALVGKVSKENHIRWLLMYHDKRFQEDANFIIVAFNQQLVRQSTTGSFMLVKRNNFAKVADSISKISPGVLARLTERLKHGGRYKPVTNEEKLCFSLLDQIEYVGGHVNGSLASKKYLRNQLWSFVAFQGAPNWFITLSPADHKHPLCVHMASHDVTFRPEVKGYAERQHLVTRNPVACARFFDFVVKLFIRHVCGWTDNGAVRGIFGKPGGYFGTVEQQGRMTLHLHFLLWIEGAPSPQEVRDRIMGGDSQFQADLVAYLESCRVGEFLTGTMDEVSAKVPLTTGKKDRGIHTIMVEDETPAVPDGYEDPTLTLPLPPPAVFCEDQDDCICDDCATLTSWYDKFTHVVDDIVRRSNVHRCFGKRDNSSQPGLRSNQNQASKKGAPKQHATGKGCINKEGVCTARFPRDTYLTTMVDLHTGHINLKKKEPWINDITPVIAAIMRCNTDTTCLLSGTAVKATLGYITDYITKSWLKTYQVFATMHDMFIRPDRNQEQDTKVGNAARRMIVRIVNSLSAKMEIGAPMAALYLLQNPDHYRSHDFKIFYWKNYVNHVENEWQKMLDNEDPEVVGNDGAALDPVDVGVSRTGQHKTDVDTGDGEENVQVRRTGNQIVSKTSTDDYRYRPREHSELSLYEWVQCSVKQYDESNRPGKRTLQFFKYDSGHPLHATHSVACDPQRQYYVVPNFVGPALPRKDTGDREAYCCTMLTFFKPWREANELKAFDQTWEDAFDEYTFTDRQHQLMNNFNIRYECYDARDDYGTVFKTSRTGTESDEDDDDEEDGLHVNEVDPEMFEGDGDDNNAELLPGPGCEEAENARLQAKIALRVAGWRLPERSLHTVNSFGLPKIAIDTNLGSQSWRRIVNGEKTRLFNLKFNVPGPATEGRNAGTTSSVRNDAYVVPATFISKDYVPSNPSWAKLINDLVLQFTLNADQAKAFKIIANHATCVAPDQLMMHLGGMGGTGKTRVIKALEAFFKARGEPYRLVLLGPTGTASALIGGSTYHSFLGLRTGLMSGESLATLEDVCERLMRVGYIFIDEFSMLACVDLCRISARICDALGIYEKAFGGLNIILAGDFAQLPPAKGKPLYSRAVSLRQTPRQKEYEQEKTIGKMIWNQFTTAVILTENMRQIGKTPDEAAFQQALMNLRWKSCTPDDIQLFRSRIAGKEHSLTLAQEPYKNVSIITTWNRVKDQFNDSNSERFAQECGEQLSPFYSSDKMSFGDATKRNKKRVYSTAKYISPAMRRTLWLQPPNTSEQVASCLRLCLGMPVIIRHNVATELCITRGQEARVVGWTSNLVSKDSSNRKLDVLYVELMKPPKTIKLPNLPVNVVPLTSISQTVDARLPSDVYIRIQRTQVPVLPNFAMTDYSSQGKTREINVVDIGESRNFHGVYTSLSRGTSLANTLILRQIKEEHLTGGLDGELRQEFRELNYLSEITQLQYEGVLPLDFNENTRWATVDKWRQWMKVNRPEVILEQPDGDEEDVHDLQPEIHTLASQKKRKASESKPVPPNKRAKRTARTLLDTVPSAMPVGPIWDNTDWSCAYDSVLFVLYWLWFSDEPRWSKVLRTYGRVMERLVGLFETLPGGSLSVTLTPLRNDWRDSMRELFPGQYPAGTQGVDMYVLARRLVGEGEPMEDMLAVCSGCGTPAPVEDAGGYKSRIGRHCVTGNHQSLQHYIDRAMGPVSECTACGGETLLVNELEELLVFEIGMPRVTDINARLVVGDEKEYRLVGVIYFGEFHFVSRVITPENKVYTHDGVFGTYSTLDGTLGDEITEEELKVCGTRRPTIVLYVAD